MPVAGEATIGEYCASAKREPDSIDGKCLDHRKRLSAELVRTRCSCHTYDVLPLAAPAKPYPLCTLPVETTEEFDICRRCVLGPYTSDRMPTG